MGNPKWELFSVGMRREEWKGLPQGMIMEWTDENGLTLFVFYERPTAEEMKEISARGQFEIAFKDIDGVGFFAIKFGSQPWGDCIFSPNLYPVAPKFEKPQAGLSYALNIMLVDVFTGELKVLRTIGLGKDFSEHFCLWSHKSLEKNMGRYSYNKIIDAAYKKYPTSEELAAEADVRWKLVHGTDEQRREEQQFE